MRTRITFAAAVAALFVLAAGCSAPRTMSYPGPQDAAFDYYVIRVDSLEVTGTGASTRFIARGIIGNNGCHQLAYVDTAHVRSEIHFTFWGSKPKQDRMCTQAIVPLNHELVFPRAGKNIVVIHQPDGSRLLRAF